MTRLVHVTVPTAHAASIKTALQACRHVHGLGVFAGPEEYLFLFRAKENKMSPILFTLEAFGVGRHFGHIDVVSLQTTKPRVMSGPKLKRREYRLEDRMSVEEIYDAIDANIHLTFDYLALTIVASLIAAAGLISDSSVFVVASMLVSPLMGPITGISLGILTQDSLLTLKCLKNEMIGIAITFGVGVLVALCVAPQGTSLTDEMESRSTYASLIWGVVVAAPSGVGVALSIANGGVNALVGVAISASLLPPITNAGIAWVYAAAAALGAPSKHTSDQFMVYGIISFALFILNFILIVFISVLIFRLKKVKLSSLEDPNMYSTDTREGEHCVNLGDGDVLSSLLDNGMPAS